MTGHTGLYPRLQAARYAAAALATHYGRAYEAGGTDETFEPLCRATTARRAADSGAYHDLLPAPYPGGFAASSGEANRESIVKRRLREAETCLIDMGALDGPCAGPFRPCAPPRRFAFFHEADKAGVTVRPVCPCCGSPNIRGYLDQSMEWDEELQHWLPTSGPNELECDDCDADWPEETLGAPVWEATGSAA